MLDHNKVLYLMMKMFWVIFVEESSSLIGRENFETKSQEPNFSQAGGFYRKCGEHELFHV